MKKQIIIPAGMQGAYDHMHFAPAVKVGDTVYVSGQAGIKADGKVAETLEEQLHLCFQKLQLVLEAAGGTLEDIVELESFHVGDMVADTATIFRVKDQYLTRDYPAWSAFGVTMLAVPGLLVEIKAVAVIGSGN
jgi:enamine deaminase RidA (YjgF/YER057c/UK114 family)